MVNMELLSDNLALILGEITKNQQIAKYVYYNNYNPQSQSDLILPARDLFDRKLLLPYPFDPTAQTEDCTQIRVYYPDGVLDGSEAVAVTSLFFDIVVAKSLWLINDGKSGIRPYMIMNHLMKHFNSSIGTLGKLDFTTFLHLNVNDKFDAIRLQAEMSIFGSGD